MVPHPELVTSPYLWTDSCFFFVASADGNKELSTFGEPYEAWDGVVESTTHVICATYHPRFSLQGENRPILSPAKRLPWKMTFVDVLSAISFSQNYQEARRRRRCKFSQSYEAIRRDPGVVSRFPLLEWIFVNIALILIVGASLRGLDLSQDLLRLLQSMRIRVSRSPPAVITTNPKLKPWSMGLIRLESNYLPSVEACNWLTAGWPLDVTINWRQYCCCGTVCKNSSMRNSIRPELKLKIWWIGQNFWGGPQTLGRTQIMSPKAYFPAIKDKKTKQWSNLKKIHNLKK